MTDVLVVGGGLAGLTAALACARDGRSVALIERLPRLGGRCGRFALDGHRFTIGCNDFGARIATDLAALGVSVPFVPSTQVVDFGDAVYRLPPGPGTAIRLLGRVPSLLRLVRRVRSGGRARLGALYPDAERDDFGFRMAALLAYAVGCPPSGLRADLLGADLQGSSRVVPRDGPQAIVDAMEAELRRAGAVVRTGVEVGGPERRGDRWVAPTAGGPIEARAVIAMARPEGGVPGLSVAQLLWETRSGAPFVSARALVVCPPAPDRWLSALDRGEWPDPAGFHLFRDVAGPGGETFTGYVHVPRGVERLDEAARSAIFERVEAGIERRAPGFRAAVRYRRCLDPSEYAALHGMGSALSVRLPGADDDPLPTVAAPGHYRIGNGAGPVGEHANAAMVSGLWAAREASAFLAG